MEIINKITEKIIGSELNQDETITIKDSIINILDFDFLEFDTEIIIENCIINDFAINSCWFKKGLKFKNNHVVNYINFEMGGHNSLPIVVENCIFKSFFNFFDCQFNAEISLTNNIFIKGTNLLGNQNEGFKNLFDNEPIINNNLGELDLNEIE